MIDEEIREIIGDESDDGTRLNQLVDDFREGRDPEELVELLDSSNIELVSLGSWILSELSVERYRKHSVLSRLQSLVRHKAPSVRLSAFGALFPALSANDDESVGLLRELLRDPNDGVRKAAESAAEQLGLNG